LLVLGKNDLRMHPKRKTNLKLREATAVAVSLMTQKPDVDDDALFLTLKQLKPAIGDFGLLVAIIRAKEALFEPEYLTEEFKQELDEWDRIE
jgi:hypothetical protein